MTTWITWAPRGHDAYTNPRARTAHLAAEGVRPGDVRNGGFPLACGRWAPDGHDAILTESSARRCGRCLHSAAARGVSS